jgi:2-polyprenyl-3-methyl-5-hydroxy-6-metoxy-1,4-benzoquinol methylase
MRLLPLEPAIKAGIIDRLRELQGNFEAEDFLADYDVHIEKYFFAARLLDTKKKVLDVACGQGYGSFILSRFSSQVVGVDIAEDRIATSSRLFHKEGNIEFILSDALRIDFHDEFDLVACFETLEHIAPGDQERFIRVLRRALKPGGILIISTPNRDAHTMVGKIHDNATSKNPHDHKLTLGMKEFIALLDKGGLPVHEYYGQGFVSRRLGNLGSTKLVKVLRMIDFLNLRRAISPAMRDFLKLPQPGKVSHDSAVIDSSLHPAGMDKEFIPMDQIAICVKQ